MSKSKKENEQPDDTPSELKAISLAVRWSPDDRSYHVYDHITPENISRPRVLTLSSSDLSESDNVGQLDPEHLSHLSLSLNGMLKPTMSVALIVRSNQTRLT